MRIETAACKLVIFFLLYFCVDSCADLPFTFHFHSLTLIVILMLRLYKLNTMTGMMLSAQFVLADLCVLFLAFDIEVSISYHHRSLPTLT